MVDITIIKKDCSELINVARIALNQERNYQKGYDLATQAEFLVRNYLVEDLETLINVLILKGLALLGLDKDKGHSFLEEVYYIYKDRVNLINKKENDLKFRLKSAFAQAKNNIGEHKESIELLTELIKDTQKRIDDLSEKNADYERHMKRIINSMIRISYSLIYLNQEEHYPDIISKTEVKIKSLSNLGNMDFKELTKEVSISTFNLEVNCQLTEAMRYLKDGERMALKFGFTDLVTACKINQANIYLEKEDYNTALNLLEDLKENDLVKNTYYGHVLNELAIAKIHLGNFAGVEGILKESWEWLSEQKLYEELARTCYAFALYHYKQGQLLNAYSFADLANTTKSQLPTIRLLYQISFLKYVLANRQGNESEYVFFKSEYDKYKAQLERRG